MHFYKVAAYSLTYFTTAIISYFHQSLKGFVKKDRYYFYIIVKISISFLLSVIMCLGGILVAKPLKEH